MTTAESIAAAAAANPVHEPAAPSPGRCIYCDERCNAKATYHDYCCAEHELERLAAAARGALHHWSR